MRMKEMERLESALAKARIARRRQYRRASVTSALDNDWVTLQSIEISAATAARRRLAALQGARASAPYDILRARVLRQMKQSGWHRLAVTSPNKSCGKTTVSANLALSFARQPELRVILMDFDLRQPAMADVFEHTGGGKIADLLSGQADFRDHALRYGRNLAICTNRSPVPMSAELVQSPATAELLDRIEARWKPDLMIFDTPPMLGNDDNLGFLAHVDCALLVGAAASTSLGQLDVCERELANLTNVVGIVLNKCRYLDDVDGYNAGYS